MNIKRSELKKWMEQNEKTATDVAAMTHVSLKTIERFLKGETDGSRLVQDAFERLMAPPEDTY